MLTSPYSNRLRLVPWIGGIGILIGIALGGLAGFNPLYLTLALGTIAIGVVFFAQFEYAVLGLLILRSAIDSFIALQLPAVFAIGLDVLTLLYVIVQLFRGKAVRTDRFWWLLVGWCLLQGVWVLFLPLGILGFDSALMGDSIREWVRLFSWVMVYLLVMQLKDRLPPQKIISALFLSLIIPLTIAVIQMVLPSILPVELSPLDPDGVISAVSEGSRIRGTLGHPNSFTTYLLLFIGLTWWKLGQTKQRWFWLSLLSILAFFYVGTKALFGLMMLAVFILVLIAPRLSVVKLIGGALFFGLVIALFASTEFGQQRLGSIANTPLLNPDIDVSRAILLAKGDNNSFNWRISQWYQLLGAWQQFPIFGYGLGSSIQVAGNGLLPHNDYVRFLVEQGVAGFSVIFLFFVAQGVHLTNLIRSVPRGTDQYRFCLILLAIFVAIPVGMMTENIWGHTMLFFYWWTLLAVAGWNWDEHHSPSPEV